jgi:hypothetical protein
VSHSSPPQSRSFDHLVAVLDDGSSESNGGVPSDKSAVLGVFNTFPWEVVAEGIYVQPMSTTAIEYPRIPSKVFTPPGTLLRQRNAWRPPLANNEETGVPLPKEIVISKPEEAEEAATQLGLHIVFLTSRRR